jgi:hypothetical protein
MCLPSGEYATESTQPECPLSVHSCSWTKHGGQNTPRSSKRSKQCQNTMTHLRARLRIPDLHGVVKRPADDVLAVRRVRYRVNGARVPRQRALLLMDQTLTSASVHAAANDTTCQNTMTHLLARRRIPDLDGPVIRPADDVLAVRRVCHREHRFRVPRQRALLLMAQIRTSASVHAAANDRAMTN